MSATFIFSMIAFILLSIAATIFYIRAYIWVLSKGSMISRFIVCLASSVFCLLMAKFNAAEQNTAWTFAFIGAGIFYLLSTLFYLNKLIPTKE